ncbi:MAG: gliding motility protein GldL [Bacteroidales bacterium]|nr:gliding motility protein GldL [Bacteroidales bacterium]
MAKLYGWGASVVILGALFKINHYPGAEYMLIMGLGTEAVIFFFSAFEPPHVEPDWSLVYPELAGMYHGITSDEEDEIEGREGLTEELDKMLENAKIGPELINSLGKGLKNLSDNTSKLSDISNAAVVTDKYIENVKGAATSVGELSNSYKKTSEVLNKDINTSEEYLKHVQSASETVSNLSNVYEQASESLKKDLSATEEFSGSIKAATESANILAEKYKKSTEILTKSAEALDFTSVEGNSYNVQLQKISNNLSALNTVYEMQLKNSNAQAETTNKFQETLNNFLSNLDGSVENTIKYKDNLSALNLIFQKQLKGSNEQVESTTKLKEMLDQFLNNLNQSSEKTIKYNEELEILAKKVSALNTIYGNMLSAMNVNINN